jgi:2-keto-4-pentenoate hydratase
LSTASFIGYTSRANSKNNGPTMQGQPTPDRALEDKLIAARRAGTRLAAQDLMTPADIASAMAAQARIFRAASGEVKGWKLSIRPDQLAVSAPLFPVIETAGDRPPAMKWHPGMAVEVEVAVRLAADLPARAGWQRADIVGAVASVHAGIEVIDSRIVEGGEAPFPMFLADAMGNGGYLVGPEVPRAFADKLDGQTITVRLDGVEVYSAPAVHPATDPLKPLTAYARAPNDALGGLKKGQIVTTGSLCGVIAVPKPARVEVVFGNAKMRLDLTA